MKAEFKKVKFNQDVERDQKGVKDWFAKNFDGRYTLGPIQVCYTNGLSIYFHVHFENRTESVSVRVSDHGAYGYGITHLSCGDMLINTSGLSSGTDLNIKAFFEGGKLVSKPTKFVTSVIEVLEKDVDLTKHTLTGKSRVTKNGNTLVSVEITKGSHFELVWEK